MKDRAAEEMRAEFAAQVCASSIVRILDSITDSGLEHTLEVLRKSVGSFFEHRSKGCCNNEPLEERQRTFGMMIEAVTKYSSNQ